MRKMSFPFVLIVLFFIASCNNDKDASSNGNTDDRIKVGTRDEDRDDSRSSSITGKWYIADYRANDGDDPNEEEMERMKSSTIEFKSDGHYIAIAKGPDGETDKESGNYRFDAKAKKLEIIEDSEDGKREAFDVDFRSKSKVVLTFSDGKITLEKD